MKSFITIVGIILILVGIATFAYRGINYTTQEQVMKLGDLELTAQHEKTLYFPPLLSGTSIAVGIILVIVARMRFK